MAFVAGAAIAAAVPSIFGAIQGIGQKRQAKRLRKNAVDPGYQQNTGVLQNAETLQNRFNNYQMPGYNQAMNNIGSSSASAFNSGVQGASSGGDVLDLATKIAYGTGQQQRQLEVQNAQGKDNAMFDYLTANAQAGQERQDANAYDRDRYQQQLAEAAAMYNAGDQNIGNAINSASSIGTSLLMNPSMSGGAGKAGAMNPRDEQIGMAGLNSAGQITNNPVLNSQQNSQSLFKQHFNKGRVPIAPRTFGDPNENVGQIRQTMPNLNPIIPLPRRSY